MTRTVLTSEFVAPRCMWLKDTFNWRATLTRAATLSPRRTIFSTPNTIFRLIAAAQAAQFQAQNGDVRATGDSSPGDLDDDDDLGDLPDRFASPGQQERQAFTNQTNVVVRAALQPYGQQQPVVRRKV